MLCTPRTEGLLTPRPCTTPSTPNTQYTQWGFMEHPEGTHLALNVIHCVTDLLHRAPERVLPAKAPAKQGSMEGDDPKSAIFNVAVCKSADVSSKFWGLMSRCTRLRECKKYIPVKNTAVLECGRSCAPSFYSDTKGKCNR